MTSTKNTTGFAHCYLMAATYLMDAIATPTEDGFKQALKWAKSAWEAAYQTGPIQSAQIGSERDLANSMELSIVSAARFYGYRI